VLTDWDRTATEHSIPKKATARIVFRPNEKSGKVGLDMCKRVQGLRPACVTYVRKD
jgi:ribosomal protein RSM22 (predicted rRNA methylase)